MRSSATITYDDWCKVRKLRPEPVKGAWYQHDDREPDVKVEWKCRNESDERFFWWWMTRN